MAERRRFSETSTTIISKLDEYLARRKVTEVNLAASFNNCHHKLAEVRESLRQLCKSLNLQIDHKFLPIFVPETDVKNQEPAIGFLEVEPTSCNTEIEVEPWSVSEPERDEHQKHEIELQSEPKKSEVETVADCGTQILISNHQEVDEPLGKSPTISISVAVESIGEQSMRGISAIQDDMWIEPFSEISEIELKSYQELQQIEQFPVKGLARLQQISTSGDHFQIAQQGYDTWHQRRDKEGLMMQFVSDLVKNFGVSICRWKLQHGLDVWHRWKIKKIASKEASASQDYCYELEKKLFYPFDDGDSDEFDDDRAKTEGFKSIQNSKSYSRVINYNRKDGGYVICNGYDSRSRFKCEQMNAATKVESDKFKEIAPSIMTEMFVRIEHPRLITCVQTLQLQFDIFSFNNAQGDCAAKYLAEKQKVMKFLEEVLGQCLMMDSCLAKDVLAKRNSVIKITTDNLKHMTISESHEEMFSKMVITLALRRLVSAVHKRVWDPGGFQFQEMSVQQQGIS